MILRLSFFALLLTSIPLVSMDRLPYVPKTQKEKNLQIAAHAQFLKAARKGNLKKLKQLLALPYLDVNTTDREGNNALHLVAADSEQRVCAMLNILINHRANIHAQNQAGQVPLHSLAGRGYAKGIALLLEKGALVHQQDTGAHTPIFYSALQPTDAFTTLLEAGASIDTDAANATDNNQNNLLHIAASCWVPEFIPVISRYGVKVNAQNKAGQTPLHAAVKRGSIATIEALIKEGALLDISDKAGNTPLHLAATLGNHAALRMLIGAGACLYIRNKAGAPPLDFENVRWIAYPMLITAIKEKDNLTVQKLLNQGINPNFPLQNNFRNATQEQTLLSVAMVSGNAQAICHLLDAGADPNQEDKLYDRVRVTPMGQIWFVSKDAICIKALKANAANMAQILITHIPKPLLIKHINAWVKQFSGTLICAKRKGWILPTDIRKLLFKQCIISTLLPEQRTAALKICEYIPWDTQDMQIALTHKDKFDSTQLTQYYPIWKEQINKVFLHKRKVDIGSLNTHD